MGNLLSKDWWMKTLARAIRTFAQTLLASGLTGLGIGDVDWMNVLSVCALASLLSVAMCIVAGVPEADTNLDVSGIDYLDDESTEDSSEE